jgi:hypothetical protein
MGSVSGAIQMKCARCDRELKKPAITFGKYGMGRVCAAKAGLLTEKQKLRQCAERDTKTRDWVQELAHG